MKGHLREADHDHLHQFLRHPKKGAHLLNSLKLKKKNKWRWYKIKIKTYKLLSNDNNIKVLMETISDQLLQNLNRDKC